MISARPKQSPLAEAGVAASHPAAEARANSLRAPFALRCGAMLIDYTLVVAVLAVATILARLIGRDARWAGTTLLTVGYLTAILLVVFNFVLLAGFTGRTLGKWVTGLRVRKSDGTTLGFGRAMLRHFVGYVLSGLAFGLGFLLAALNAEGRALHDLIAGTVVVRDRRGARRTAPR